LLVAHGIGRKGIGWIHRVHGVHYTTPFLAYIQNLLPLPRGEGIEGRVTLSDSYLNPPKPSRIV
jgi:hypothetical protein